MTDMESTILYELVKEIARGAKKSLLEDEQFKNKLVQTIKQEMIGVIQEDFVRDELYEALIDQGVMYDIAKTMGQQLKKIVTKSFKEAK